MKKKVLAAILAAAIILVGCGGNDGGKEDDPVQTLEPVVVDETPEPSPEATEEPGEEAEAEPEETREGMYRSELTNEWIDEELKDQRPSCWILPQSFTSTMNRVILSFFVLFMSS